MGGNTGSNIIRIVSRIAKDRNIETVCIVTTPFEFEGKMKMNKAQDTIKDIKANADLLFVYNNEELMRYPETSMNDAFGKCDAVVAEFIERTLKK